MHAERVLSAGLLMVALLANSAAHAAPIVIGQGPSLGTDRAGDTWYQEFQDWAHSDLRALDQVGAADAVYGWNDGYNRRFSSWPLLRNCHRCNRLYAFNIS